MLLSEMFPHASGPAAKAVGASAKLAMAAANMGQASFFIG
jgi:hypothetical protein